MFDGLYHPFMVCWGMVGSCYTHIRLVRRYNMIQFDVLLALKSNLEDIKTLDVNLKLAMHWHPVALFFALRFFSALYSAHLVKFTAMPTLWNHKRCCPQWCHLQICLAPPKHLRQQKLL